ncbi:MAG: hypothetical protein HY289_11325 [Planctomycetes bacterium]|nr:hypothetical protein [Planctomycetota bacterium]
MQLPSRSTAWYFIVFGILAAIVGLGSLIAGEKKIYLGALVIAPIMVIRGVWLLNAVNKFYKENAHLEAAHSASPEAVKTLALSPQSIRIDVACESCGTAYVYFPERTQEALDQFSKYGEAASPCPNCGWVQSFMHRVGGPFTARPFVVKLLAFAAVAGFCASTVAFMYTMMFFYGGSREVPPVSEPTCWTVVVSGLSLGAICGIAWLVMRGGNPNQAPLAMRLEAGKRLGMTLAAYQAMINTEGWNASQAPVPTNKTDGHVKPGSGTGQKPETGIQETA